MMASARTILSYGQRWALLDAQGGRLIARCFGAGVNSTAMMLALKAADLRPQVITFADTDLSLGYKVWLSRAKVLN